MYKYMVKIFLTLAIILSLQSTTMFAQENNTINKIKNDTSGIIELPSLQEIYAIALQYSPFIKSEKGLIDIKKRELKSVKNDWLDLVKIGGNYNLRENKNIYNYPETDLTNSVNNLNNVYGVGVSFQISLYTILNRRNEVKISKIKYENQQNIYDNSLQLFKNQINTYYLDVKMKEDIYVLSIESLSVANVTHNYAELELKNNNIDLEDYSSIHERKVRMQQSYFISKKEYLEALSILEVTIGQNLR
jgi:outer membrane protein TolC